MHCQRPGCKKTVSSSRRKYCSRRCGRVAYRQGYNLRSRDDHLPRRKEWTPDTAVRTCLKCARDFISAGPGNRICPRCSVKNINFSVRCVMTPAPTLSLGAGPFSAEL